MCARCDAAYRAQNRFYGYRRILVELRKEGFDVNHKRVLRLMRQDNLLCLRKRPFVPITTQSQHSWPVVPNLARSMVPTGLNQLWVADITYVRMREEFAYLAIVLDAFSRRVIGWALDDHLNTSLAVAALRMAIDIRKPQPGSVVHHSDRGVQYASGDYTLLLEAHGIVASMSELHGKRVDLYLHQQGLDTSTPAGKALFQMMGVFAEFERAMIRERVNAGLARARATDVKLGRPTVAPNVEQRVRELRAQGMGGDQDWSRSRRRHWNRAAYRRCGSIIAAGVIAAWTSSIVNSNLHSNRYVNLLTTTGYRAEMVGPGYLTRNSDEEMS